jgi:hypothetical protein
VDVFSEDWDNLVILDACRYDMFEQASDIDGTLSSRISKGSATTEWLRANFDNRDLRDTVYVTANPQLQRHREQWDVRLHETVDVWRNEGWDEKTGTVRAETLTEVAIDAFDRFPNKRLVVHYMQPHYPFVPAETTVDKEHLNTIGESAESPTGESVWERKFAGDLALTRAELWTMYRDNLAYVLESVAELLPELSGKTVVTSDHGNYVGERASPIPIREYGHPRGIYDDVLVRVPWLEVPYDERREIGRGSSAVADDVDAAAVADKLRHLGYKE